MQLKYRSSNLPICLFQNKNNINKKIEGYKKRNNNDKCTSDTCLLIRSKSLKKDDYRSSSLPICLNSARTEKNIIIRMITHLLVLNSAWANY